MEAGCGGVVLAGPDGPQIPLAGPANAGADREPQPAAKLTLSDERALRHGPFGRRASRTHDGAARRWVPSIAHRDTDHVTCPTLRISHASCRPAAAGAVVDWSPDSTAPGSAAGRSASTPRSVRRGALACLGHGTSALLGRVHGAVGRGEDDVPGSRCYGPERFAGRELAYAGSRLSWSDEPGPSGSFC